MIDRSSDHIGLAALDGSMALALTVSAVMFSHLPVASFSHLSGLKISPADAAFGLLFVILWQYCFSILSLYDRFATLPSRMVAIFKGVIAMIIPVILYLACFHGPFLNFRTVVYIFACLFGYEINRIVLRDTVLDRISARNPQTIMIIGTGRRAAKAWREIRTRYHSSTKVLGFIDDRSPEEMAPDIAARYLGGLDSLSDLLLTNTVDIVLVAMPIRSSYHLMQRAVTMAEEVGLRVIYLNDIYLTKWKPEQPNRQLFQDLFPAHEHYLLRLAVKRLVDIVIASMLLIILSPILACVAIAVKITSKGPAFFRQTRLGYKRRPFQIVKFRSMVHDAEARMAELEGLNELSGPIFKMKRDPRATSIGRLLRSTSIDELPQLWNVLTGEMSLVGPRPMSLRDVSLFNESTLMRRFSVKPGITGLLQVQGRSSVGFEEWITLDKRYIDQWSLMLDLKIMVWTIAAVLKRSGAM